MRDPNRMLLRGIVAALPLVMFGTTFIGAHAATHTQTKNYTAGPMGVALTYCDPYQPVGAVSATVSGGACFNIQPSDDIVEVSLADASTPGDPVSFKVQFEDAATNRSELQEACGSGTFLIPRTATTLWVYIDATAAPRSTDCDVDRGSINGTITAAFGVAPHAVRTTHDPFVLAGEVAVECDGSAGGFGAGGRCGLIRRWESTLSVAVENTIGTPGQVPYAIQFEDIAGSTVGDIVLSCGPRTLPIPATAVRFLTFAVDTDAISVCQTQGATPAYVVVGYVNAVFS